MPKMKTHRGAKKRFKLSATGKVRFKHAHLRHCLEHKQKTTKKKLQKTGTMAPGDARKVKAMLPYDGLRSALRPRCALRVRSAPRGPRFPRLRTQADPMDRRHRRRGWEAALKGDPRWLVSRMR